MVNSMESSVNAAEKSGRTTFRKQLNLDSDMGENTRKKKKYEMKRRRPAQIFNCTECGKIFKHPSKIAEHMRVHTGEKPYRCDICGTRFTQGGPLKVHLRMHSGIRPYKCAYCERTFASSSHKRTHEKTHVRTIKDEKMQRVFICSMDGCPFRHIKKDVVTAHIRLVHPDLEQFVIDGMEKKVMISTVEELIEKVVEPDDVQVEEVWQHQPHRYYANGVPVDMSEGIVTSTGDYELGDVVVVGSHQDDVLPVMSNSDEFIDARLEGDTATMCPTGSASNLTNGMIIDEESSEPVFVANEEVVIRDMAGGKAAIYRCLPTEENFYVSPNVGLQRLRREREVEDVIMKEELRENMIEENDDELIANGEILVRDTHLQPRTSTFLDQCQFVDPDDDMLRPSVEEEVETSDEVYIEVDESHDNYVYIDGSTSPAVSYVTQRRYYNGDDTSHSSGSEHVEIEPSDSVALVCKRRGVVADPRPPRKGRKRADSECIKIEVDPSISEMAAPVKKSPYVMVDRSAYMDDCPSRPARNLDWIIDAVARGENVDEASPHNRRKPQVHQCEYCGRINKYPSKIKAHMRTHTGEKPFECAICGMCFAQRTPMRMHIRRHLNQKPYVCEIDGCGQRFINGSVLHAHQDAKHFQRKRYICMRGCGRWFTRAYKQRNHEMICTFKMQITQPNETIYTHMAITPQSGIQSATLQETIQNGHIIKKFEQNERQSICMDDDTEREHSALLESVDYVGYEGTSLDVEVSDVPCDAESANFEGN